MFITLINNDSIRGLTFEPEFSVVETSGSCFVKKVVIFLYFQLSFSNALLVNTEPGLGLDLCYIFIVITLKV